MCYGSRCGYENWHTGECTRPEKAACALEEAARRNGKLQREEDAARRLHASSEVRALCPACEMEKGVFTRLRAYTDSPGLYCPACLAFFTSADVIEHCEMTLENIRGDLAHMEAALCELNALERHHKPHVDENAANSGAQC